MDFVLCTVRNPFVSLLFLAGEWPKNEITNRDAIRLQLACDVMGIDARQSIFYTAVNAFGKERLTTM